MARLKQDPAAVQRSRGKGAAREALIATIKEHRKDPDMLLVIRELFAVVASTKNNLKLDESIGAMLSAVAVRVPWMLDVIASNLATSKAVQ